MYSNNMKLICYWHIQVWIEYLFTHTINHFIWFQNDRLIQTEEEIICVWTWKFNSFSLESVSWEFG